MPAPHNQPISNTFLLLRKCMDQSFKLVSSLDNLAEPPGEKSVQLLAEVRQSSQALTEEISQALHKVLRFEQELARFRQLTTGLPD